MSERKMIMAFEAAPPAYVSADARAVVAALELIAARTGGGADTQGIEMALEAISLNLGNAAMSYDTEQALERIPALLENLVAVTTRLAVAVESIAASGTGQPVREGDS